MTKLIAADFDFHNDIEKKETKLAFKKISEITRGIEWHIYFEKSKSGDGYHLWTFFSELVKSWKARKFMMALLESAGAIHLTSMDRLFPSQDRIYKDGKKFGNLIHLPFSAKFIDQGTYFIDGKGEKWTNKPEDLELFVENIVQHSGEELDSILDSWGLLDEIESDLEYETDDTNYDSADNAIELMMDDPFIRWCKENPKQVDYSAWFALIANLLPLGDSGIELIHDLSMRDMNRYDRKKCSEKIIQCQGVNPITYNWICENTNFKNKSKVKYKSPIVAATIKIGNDSVIREKLGKYYSKKTKSLSELSNFIIIPKLFVSHLDGSNDSSLQRIVDIKTRTKIIKNIAITGKMISSLDQFNEHIINKITDAYFYGAKKDLMQVFDYLNQTYPSTPTIVGKLCIGLHKNKKTGKWVVLTQSSAWDSIGQVEDLVYYNPAYKKNIIYTSAPKISQSEINSINEYLFRFNGFSQISSILAWMFALPVKQRIYEAKRLRFPVLMIHGQAGSGKTDTMRFIIKRFFGDQATMYIAGDQTNFTFLNMLGSSNTFPIFLDEYKPVSFSSGAKKLISQMIRSVYDNTSASRGQKNMTIKDYPIIAPLVICGESGFNEPALMERSVDVFMSKEDSKPNLDHFNNLKKQPLMAFGNDYLNWTLRLSDNEILDIYYKELKDNHDRPSHNIAVMRTGLEMLSLYFKQKNITPHIESVKDVMEETQMANIKEYGETASVVDNILEAIYTMKDLGMLNGEMVTEGDYSGESGLYLRGIYPQFREWANKTNFEYEIIPLNEFRKQLRKMDYFIDYKPVRFEGNLKKAFVLNAEKLRKKDIIQD